MMARDKKIRRTPALQSASALSEPLHRQLTGYALAAGAAGVSVLACSVAADAAPVCGNLSVTLSYTGTYALNPASQAIPPFNIAQTFENVSSLSNTFWNRGFFTPNSAGANVLLGSKGLPASLASGASIGPNGRFGKGQSYGLLFSYGPNNGGKFNHHRGNLDFGNSMNLVGFKFSLAGQPHYGWVRLQITFARGAAGTTNTFTHILGWGYETSPKTAILAGSCTASSAGDATGRPASLGALALGSVGLPLWRRPEPEQ